MFIVWYGRLCKIGMWQPVTRQSSMSKDPDEFSIIPNLAIVHRAIDNSISR